MFGILSLSVKSFSYTTEKTTVVFLILAFKFNRMRKANMNSMKSQWKSVIKMKSYLQLYGLSLCTPCCKGTCFKLMLILNLLMWIICGLADFVI